MNRNDMRSVVYLIIALIALYYLLDEFYGKRKISNWTDNFIGDFGGLPAKTSDSSNDTTGGGAAATQPSTAPAAVPAKTSTVKDPGSVKIPAPELDPGAVKIPKPQGNQKPATKSGSGGFSLNDVFGSFNPFPLGIPALAGEGAAIVGGVGALLTLPQTIARGAF
jgi:hypothetical protein